MISSLLIDVGPVVGGKQGCNPVQRSRQAGVSPEAREHRTDSINAGWQASPQRVNFMKKHASK